MSDLTGNRKLTDLDRRRVKGMWENGEKLSFIALTLKVHERTISNEVRRQGLAKRTGHERYERQAAE